MSAGRSPARVVRGASASLRGETGLYELSRTLPPRVRGRCRAVIKAVDEGSPAWEAGLEPGMVLTEVDGFPLTDVIEWRWRADGFGVEVTLDDGEVAYLERDLGQDWGLSFTDSIFDGLITCRNACTFCFMTMLPKGMRPTLYLRDDDYRLSFLQGNFVTLTNLDDSDVRRIIDYDLQPLHVSLHAVSPDVRRALIGANAPRGMEVLERLLAAGIQVHAQLVVCPGVNDGAELERTLDWVNARDGVLTCGIVPLGYTRFQSAFSRSFSDDPALAGRTIDVIEARQGTACKFQVADEFYLDAGRDFPPAEFYRGYPQFQDGIGMMRSFIDDWHARAGDFPGIAARRAAAGDPPVTVVVGESFAKVLAPLVEGTPLSPHLLVLPVENRFFGGNVDVTCLLAGTDLVDALCEAAPPGKVVLPRENFNQDSKALDDVPLSEISRLSGAEVELRTYSADELIDSLS